MVSKKSAKNRGSQWYAMSAIVPTEVTLKGNVGSLDAPRTAQLFTFGPRGQGISLRGS